VASGLVAQGVAIYDSLRGGVLDYDDEQDEDTAVAPLVPNSDSSQRDR